MYTRSRSIPLFPLILVFLSLPAVVSAQDRHNNPWYGNDRSYRRERRYNERYRTNSQQSLRNAVQRVDRLSGQLKGDLGDALDRSQIDGQDREDRINELAHDFHEAAAKFRDRFDDGRDLNRAEAEARRVLELGNRLDRFIGRHQLSTQVDQKWTRISEDLRIIADVYGSSYGYWDDRTYDDDDPFYRGRNDDRRERRRW